MKDLDYETLDPGIREVVRMLRSEGYDTTDSGDGVSKPEGERAFDCPHVVATWRYPQEEAEYMKGILGAGWEVEASYGTKNKRWVLIATKQPDMDLQAGGTGMGLLEVLDEYAKDVDWELTDKLSSQKFDIGHDNDE